VNFAHAQRKKRLISYRGLGRVLGAG